MTSFSICWEGGVTALEEMSWSKESRVKAVFSDESILSPLSEHVLCCLGWRARVSLPLCLRQHHFYSVKKDRHLHLQLPNIGIFLSAQDAVGV